MKQDMSTKETTPQDAAPPAQGPSYQELLQLVELIKASSRFSDFRFRSGEFELEIRRGPAPSGPSSPHDARPSDAQPSPAHRGAATAGREAPNGAVAPAQARGSPAAEIRPAAPPIEPAAAVPEGATVLRSPMVGTFYRAPEPGAAPFVEVGTRVEPDTVVCIIEVMKLMNSIPARCRGVVSRILVDDGEAVEYGRDLVVIDPDRS
jgi:acetyl-CoA carboxylase biotin carboxyl carrier protein